MPRSPRSGRVRVPPPPASRSQIQRARRRGEHVIARRWASWRGTNCARRSRDVADQPGCVPGHELATDAANAVAAQSATGTRTRESVLTADLPPRRQRPSARYARASIASAARSFRSAVGDAFAVGDGPLPATGKIQGHVDSTRPSSPRDTIAHLLAPPRACRRRLVTPPLTGPLLG